MIDVYELLGTQNTGKGKSGKNWSSVCLARSFNILSSIGIVTEYYFHYWCGERIRKCEENIHAILE